MSESSQPKANEKAATQPAKPDEPMREVLTRLLESAHQLSEPDRQLGLRIRDLGIAARDPLQFNQTGVQVAVASVAQEFERTTGKQLDLSAAQRAEITKLNGSPAASPADATSTPKNDGAAKPSTQSPPDPIRDVLTKLVASVDQIPNSAKELGTRIRDLEQYAQDPVRFNQKIVRHEVAYAAQDFEKATGKQLDLAPGQRAEVTRLAASAPGLENERMLALLKMAPQIEDHNTVREIRRTAADIGLQNNQSASGTQSRIDNLENRIRLATRPPEASNDQQAGDRTSKAETPGATSSSSNAASSPHKGPSTQEPPAAQTAVLRGGVLDTLTAALRGNGNRDNAPWDPQATPFGDRVRAFQAKADARDQDRVIGRVENSARAALDALDGFRNTEGSAVMNRIQTAARAEPGGMARVLSEMREGGRFSDLRQSFNAALNDDKGFAQAYDKAASALARYGQGREQVEHIIAKRPDAANLAAKFEQLDGQIGERASSTPSRNEGKNMLDDISKTIAEVIQNAAEKVRAMFTRTPGASAGPAPAA